MLDRCLRAPGPLLPRRPPDRRGGRRASGDRSGAGGRPGGRRDVHPASPHRRPLPRRHRVQLCAPGPAVSRWLPDRSGRQPEQGCCRPHPRPARGPGAGKRGRMSAEPQTGTEAVAAVATRAASVSDIVAGCLEKVRELDATIGAFRVMNEDAALSAAKELDDQVAGPLHGLVVGVKDVIDTADLPTGYGSPLFAGHQPSADADVVAALRRSGALVLGKTEPTHFAIFQPPRTPNPPAPAPPPPRSSRPP